MKTAIDQSLARSELHLRESTELTSFQKMLLNVDWFIGSSVSFAIPERLLPGGGGVLPRILDRGVPRRFLNPNPI